MVAETPAIPFRSITVFPISCPALHLQHLEIYSPRLQMLLLLSTKEGARAYVGAHTMPAKLTDPGAPE